MFDHSGVATDFFLWGAGVMHLKPYLGIGIPKILFLPGFRPLDFVQGRSEDFGQGPKLLGCPR